MKRSSWSMLLGLVVLSMVTVAKGQGMEIAPFAKKLPQGYRDLGFGMTEDAAKAAVNRMNKGGKPFERSMRTFAYSIDLAGKRVVKLDLDAATVRHYSVNSLDPEVSTLHAWFEQGKLVGVDALSSQSRQELVSKLTQQYGTEPRTLTLDYADETAHFANTPPKPIQVSLWKGTGVTAIVFEPTGWGPEVLVISDQAIADFNRLHAAKAPKK